MWGQYNEDASENRKNDHEFFALVAAFRFIGDAGACDSLSIGLSVSKHVYPAVINGVRNQYFLGIGNGNLPHLIFADEF